MRFLIVLFLLFVLVTPVSLANTENVLPDVSENEPERIDPQFEYDVNYDLGFLWLDKVAVANFKLQKSTRPDIYIASLSAKTVGMAATLTNNRKQRYVSMMRKMPDGNFRSVRHTSQKEKGGIVRAKIYMFDYEKGAVKYQYFKNNKLIDEYDIEIDRDRAPSDILTTYVNLVTGAFGSMEVGAHYKVPTFSKKGIGDITIDFLSADKRPKKSFFSEDLLICRVLVDQEVFDTKDGVIYIGYDEKRLPARGVVTDIIGMGDVRGVMK